MMAGSRGEVGTGPIGLVCISHTSGRDFRVVGGRRVFAAWTIVTLPRPGQGLLMLPGNRTVSLHRLLCGDMLLDRANPSQAQDERSDHQLCHSCSPSPDVLSWHRLRANCSSLL